MVVVLYALIGILVGLLAGLLLPVAIPAAWSVYVAVTLLAILSSLVGAIKANLSGEFDPKEFASGLLGNALLGVGLAWLGNRLDVPGYLAAVLYLGFRIFYNFNDIRKRIIGEMPFVKGRRS